MIAKLKPIFAEGALLAAKVEAWLALLTPKAADDNSVVKEAQESIKKAITNLRQDCCVTFRDVFSF